MALYSTVQMPFIIQALASLLLILSVSLFCLVLSVTGFLCLFSLFFLPWDSQSVPVQCLHLLCAMQSFGTPALNMADSLSPSSAE